LIVLAALAVALSSVVSAADAKTEAEAKKLQGQAMDFDFLALDLAKAKAKLGTALKKCGNDKCSPGLVAALQRDLGIVLFHLGDKDGGEKAFASAFVADPDVTIGKDFLQNAAIKKAWEAAKKKKPASTQPAAPSAPEGPPEVDGALGVSLTIAPVGYELPMVVDVPEALDPASVKVSFKSEAMDKYRPVEAKKSGKKWLAVLPCDATAKPGVVRFYVKAYDDAGTELEHFASIKKPAQLTVVKALPEDVEPPTLPGGREPKSCDQVASGKPEGAGCREDAECDQGLACVENDAGKKWCKPGVAKGPSQPKLWIGVDGTFDMVFLGPEKDLCKQDSWTCSVDTPAGRRDVGISDSAGINVLAGTGGKTDGGLSFATKRVFLSVDYFIVPRLSLGLRAGVAFGGNTTEASKFFPLHAEGRLQYFITDGVFRPYFLFNTGYAELDAPVPNVIVEPNDPANANGCSNGGDPPTCGESGSRPVINGVQAWKRAGPFFLGAGIGAWLFVTKNVALNVAAKGVTTVPRTAFALMPELGIKVGF
jgi:hypothetical protein